MNIANFFSIAKKVQQFILIGIILSVCLCSPQSGITDGGGTRGGNPVIVGSIVDTNGVKSENIRITLIPANYNPLTDDPIDSTSITFTDSTGSFTINAPDSGVYSIEATDSRNGTRLIKFNITASMDSTLILPKDTLHVPGTLRISLIKASYGSGSYLYVPGTTIGAVITQNTENIIVDHMPIGTFDLVFVSPVDDGIKKSITSDVSVQSEQVTRINNPLWNQSRQIVFNTSTAGAGTTSDQYGFVVLVRLTKSNFDFLAAQTNGEDLLFTDANNKPLPFEIEHWDTVAQKASVWVRIDTLFGNRTDQSITLFWGNPDAPSLSLNSAVFDTTAGFQGVWHMGDASLDSIHDATVNGYNGWSSEAARPEVTDGIIGECRQFDGQSDIITMPGTSNSKLNFAEDAQYSVSAWVYVNSFDSASHCIIAKGYEQYYLRTTLISRNIINTTPQWEFVEFSESEKWQTLTESAASGQWVLLTGVCKGSNQYLYSNGELVDSSVAKWQNAVSRNTQNDLAIGGFLKPVTVPVSEGTCPFKGSIDEVRILNRAQSSDWIRLCYMNQRPDDRLVVFK